MPLVRRTRATLRSAEFGFFGVWVKTRTQTPRFWGLTCNAGLFVLVTIFLRPCRTSWLIVGINDRGSFLRGHAHQRLGIETSSKSPPIPYNTHTQLSASQPVRCFRPEEAARRVWRLKLITPICEARGKPPGGGAGRGLLPKRLRLDRVS